MTATKSVMLKTSSHCSITPQEAPNMNQHNITNESLALALILVVVALLVSKKEKLGLEKDIIWSIARAIVQLVVVGYVLKYIFDLDNGWLTVLMVLFICVNAALNAKKRSRNIDNGFVISFIAISVGAALDRKSIV